MRKWMIRALVVVPLVAGGIVYAASSKAEAAKPTPVSEGYICPITGEELPCPNCCPLNSASK